MVAEYAAEYGGPPAASMPWVLFLALVRRAPMFQARRRLVAWDGAAAAIGGAFGEVDLAADHKELSHTAYPFSRDTRQPKFVPNLLNPDASDG